MNSYLYDVISRFSTVLNVSLYLVWSLLLFYVGFRNIMKEEMILDYISHSSGYHVK